MSISTSLGDLVRRELSGTVELTGPQVSALESHYALLLRWNERMNLTTITELHEAALRHYCESLYLATKVTGRTIVDVGSGAGFPGIPVAILQADWSITLIEAHQRKAVFLREAARALRNVQVLALRAEACTGRFDWMVSRAVDPKSLMKLRLADRYAILAGEEDARLLPGSELVPLPWGHNRVIATGSLS